MLVYHIHLIRVGLYCLYMHVHLIVYNGSYLKVCIDFTQLKQMPAPREHTQQHMNDSKLLCTLI